MTARRADGLFGVLEAAAATRGYWFPRRTSSYDLFVFGVRAAPTSSNLFDDALGVAYVAGGVPRVEVFAGTTDPGRAALDHPVHAGGTATLVPGQYRKLWTRGLHRGQYPALVQRSDVGVRVYRGSDRTTVHFDAVGINLHHAGSANARRAAAEGIAGARVDWYSAGCQVCLFPEDLSRILELVGLQVRAGLGGWATYTLFAVSETPELAPALPA